MTNTGTNNLLVGFIIAAWAALILVLNAFGVFSTPPDKLPLPLLISVVAPPILFLAAYVSSVKVRRLSLGFDLRFMTAIQAWRMIGAMFLVLMSFGLLPGTFAWPAGIGDMIVSAYAPFVVVAISRRKPGWYQHVVLLNVLGLLDFVGAIGGGVLSGRSPIGFLRGPVTADIMQELPLSLIPTFAVPFWIILHVISLIKLRHPEAITEEHKSTE
jgi:hypothetical protein